MHCVHHAASLLISKPRGAHGAAFKCSEAISAQPSTSTRDAGDRKQTADLTATQLARNEALIGALRGKVVSSSRLRTAFCNRLRLAAGLSSTQRSHMPLAEQFGVAVLNGHLLLFNLSKLCANIARRQDANEVPL